MTKIPIFYQKDSLDGFLAAHAAKSILPPIAESIAVSPGDTLPPLDGCFPLFFDVDFTKLAVMPDMSKCGQCVFVLRYSQADILLKDFRKLPCVKVPGYTAPLRFKMYFNDFKSITNTAWDALYSRERRKEIIPSFITYIIDAFENQDLESPGKKVIEGLKQEQTFLFGDIPAFEQRFIKPFDEKKQDILKVLEEAGSKNLDAESDMIKKMVDRNTVMTNFAGFRVKLAQMPEEFSHRAGSMLAKDMPFAVIIEDRYSENIRIYHLYSNAKGKNVAEIGAPYKAIGNARYATFTAKINFSDYKFV